MRILIDTNIFISLEGSPVLEESYLKLIKILKDNNFEILIHPSSLKDLNRDKNEVRKNSNLARVRFYKMLERPPDYSQEFESKYGIISSKENDIVDNEILSAVYGNAVHFLITEDNGIHQKAKKVGVSGTVFYLQQALQSFSALLSHHSIQLPNIELVYVYEIKKYLQTMFFDSLRDDYDRFDDWFIKCCKSGREAWIHKGDDGSLGAICIFKTEEQQILTTDKGVLPGQSLKLCTFKVGQTVQGRKIGELFLKAAFRYAFKNNLENIYLTMKSNQKHLANLCEDFGFSKFGEDNNGDYVYVKKHPQQPPEELINPLSYHKLYSPHFIGKEYISKFIIPIQPSYHEQLFPDWIPDQPQLKLKLPCQNSLPGNAIKLAYLCNANTKALKPGDVIFFYRTGDYKELTSVGIIESAQHSINTEEILKLVSKRTVYNKEEIEGMAKRQCLVILFRLALHLSVPVGISFLKDVGVEGNIQSVRAINQRVFNQIVARAGVQNCVFTD